MGVIEESDFSADTWLSVLGLLKPYEYFVTVDNFPVWYRHVAWAKSNGGELRAYTTERFSSNMVFMSLLLGIEISTFFDSSDLATDMRIALTSRDYSVLKYWIGVVIIINVILTIAAIIATFTAWGMVSAISDENSHVVLRSSIGQYATHLPSRLIVAAFYSFLFWISLFIVEVMSGFPCVIILSVICLLFIKVISVYSALGRVIINAGAMGKKPILDPQLQSQLLPSGLHQCLLIKATANLTKLTNVVNAYENSNGNMDDSRSSLMSQTSNHSTSSKKSSPGETSARKKIVRRFPRDNSTNSRSKTKSSPGTITARKKIGSRTPSPKENGPNQKKDTIHFQALDIDDETSDEEVMEFIRRTSHSSAVSNESNKQDTTSSSTEPSLKQHRRINQQSSLNDNEKSLDIGELEKETEHKKAISSSKKIGFILEKTNSQRHNQPQRYNQALTKRKSNKLRQEWNEEKNARAIYDISPPAEIPSDDEKDMEEDAEACDSGYPRKSVFWPRVSVLNGTKGRKSIQSLTKETIQITESQQSMEETQETQETHNSSQSLTFGISTKADPFPDSFDDDDAVGVDNSFEAAMDDELNYSSEDIEQGKPPIPSLPRPSILNAPRGLRSMRKLTAETVHKLNPSTRSSSNGFWNSLFAGESIEENQENDTTKTHGDESKHNERSTLLSNKASPYHSIGA